MEAYKLWVRKNKEFVHSLESLANGVTWLLPERFSNSEIGPEAVYAFLGILSAVNQHIIDSAPTGTRPPGSGESLFPWSLCISTLKDAETVVEVAAQHLFGDGGKWNFIAVTEAAKVLVRLALLRDSGYKMLLKGGEVVNAEKVEDSTVGYHGGSGAMGPAGYQGPGFNPDYLGDIPRNLEGRAISALSRFGDNAKMASDPMWLNTLRRASEAPAACPIEKPTLSTIWSEKGISGGLFVTGEVLSIVRPLIYVLLIRKYGLRSWRPWLLSLAVDLTGISILSSTTSAPHIGGDKFHKLSTSEKDEMRRRKLILAFYIMRDPFFTKYTRHHLETTERYLGHVPFVGFLTGKLVELIIGAQTRYTYTSAS